MFATSACTSIPERRFAIESISVEGANAIDSSELEEHLASRESPKFLGVLSGVVYDHQVFNRHVLEADLQRIERYYRARGYYRARVRAGRVDYVDGRKVRIEIVVEEGPPVTVEHVFVSGLDQLPAELALEARTEVGKILGAGALFDEQAFEDAAKKLESVLANHGYAHARVERRARVDLPRNRATATFSATPGPLTRYGEVTLRGLGSIPEEPVRRALDISPGAPFSREELEAAERALLDLGVFSAVSVRADLPRQRGRGRGRGRRAASNAKADTGSPNQPLPTVVPVVVTVEPSKLRSVRLGVGLHADTLRTDLHLTAGWEHQNLLGGLQHFLVEFVPGIVFYPTRVPGFQAPEAYLPEARLRSEFREPGFLEARTNALIRAEASVYPVLLTSDPDPEAPILGYQDLRASVGLDRRLFKLYGSISHNVQMNQPFTYEGPLDEDLDTALVSYPELLTSLDLRDDGVNPHSGLYLENRLQVAGVGGDAIDVKVEPEARVFVPLGRRLTFAVRGGIGLLFAQNYGDTVLPNTLSGQPGDASRAEWVRDVQLMFMRGLFSGGPTSNRGYRAREVGPHGVVPFYNPGQSTADIASECSDNESAECRLPLGGFTLWEASVELRFPIFGPLRGAVFSDVSDVAPEQLQFRFDRLHLSAGLGARYATPLGPVRLDVGYRIPGLQAPDGASGEGIPDEIFGLPIAISLGIGAPF
ncbi:MAG TPA: POTRA domain-containing protein [Polyangiaceae bacterium]